MGQMFRRRHVLAAGFAGGFAAGSSRSARAQAAPIKIGVLTDMVGAYAANTGPGSVVGARLAIEDFAKAHPRIKVELVSADLQLKPDVAVAIAGDWFNNQGVDLITDVPLSSAAFAIGDMVKAKDKVAIFTGGASADITGKHCGPNHLHWAYDTWCMPHAVVDATVKDGGDTWYFITADYAFGHSLENDAASFVVAAHGKVLGQALAPFPGTTDFSSYLVQAQSSGAKVIGFANGGNDTVNCIKQAAEFGLQKTGAKIAGLLFLIHDVHGVGLQAAQGVLLTEPFYWNLNEHTRAFTKRYAGRMPNNVPGSVHAAQYSAVTHYLKAVAALGVDKAKASGRTVVEWMKANPTDDPLFGKGLVRTDGRKIHDMYLFEVKSPAQSKMPFDYYITKRVVPAAQAFRPLDQGGCPLVRS
ncbi:MAG TPA: ABC transporter substrate-binding protein [Rhodopila sp.]|uniref:ABC transporter substrate-binding protein n=1 Tax=Rhodopila sp. TaxID=2480087 RepID=UPI002B5EA523|nr:ABC transporter substrate-binding protein [Rhodopila sp.]HVY15221.1 ABC transporter substrate-binding protein [Rhodopila sp.]